MKDKLIKSFAVGMFVASSISGIAYFTTKGEAASPKTEVKQEKLTVDEMKATLVNEGYVIQTQSEIDEKQTTTENEWKQKLADAEKKASENNTSSQQEKVVYKTMVTVTKGMTSIDVGRALVKAKIIKGTAIDFWKTVEKKKVENNLRPGTYEVDSSMDTNKIISTIFKD